VPERTLEEFRKQRETLDRLIDEAQRLRAQVNARLTNLRRVDPPVKATQKVRPRPPR
jgi:hypothetical protein